LYDAAASGANSVSRGHLRASLERLSDRHGFELVAVRDAGQIAALDPSGFSVVVFSGDAPPAAFREALDRHVASGGGLLAMHAGVVALGDAPFLPKARTLPAPVRIDAEALKDPDLQGVFEGLASPVTLRDRWITAGAAAPGNVRVLLRLGAAQNRGGQILEGAPVVWSRDKGRGRVVYNALGKENVYAQSGGYGQTLLWNLLCHAASGSAALSKPAAIQMERAPRPTSLARSPTGLTGWIADGMHTVRVLDGLGRLVASGNFRGPGAFQLKISHAGVLTVRVDGPEGTYRKRLAPR
jgi:hypothetical protein